MGVVLTSPLRAGEAEPQLGPILVEFSGAHYNSLSHDNEAFKYAATCIPQVFIAPTGGGQLSQTGNSRFTFEKNIWVP